MRPVRYKGPATALALLALGGCRGSEESKVQEPTTVRTVHVAPAIIADRVVLSGRVAPVPDRDAVLAPPVAGRLTRVEVREGETVRKGSILARVETAGLDDALAVAVAAENRSQSEAAFREREARRSRELFEKGVASRHDAEADEAAAATAAAERATASAALADARRRRQWAEIVAPFDGVVLRVIRREGEQVDGSPATPVIELASSSPVEIALDATADALARIPIGARADVSPRGSTGASFPCRVVRTARAVDPSTGVGELRLQPEDPRAALLLGAPVEARITIEAHRAAVTVPPRALRRGGGGATEVVVVEGGKTRAIEVKTGLADGEHVEVLSGLSGTEDVVVDDPLGLEDGTVVRTAE